MSWAAAGGGSCELVEPEGVRSERAYDLGVAEREYNGPFLPGDMAR